MLDLQNNDSLAIILKRPSNLTHVRFEG